MFYEITNSAGDVQTTLMDKLKSQGCNVIQTSSGIVVRSQDRIEEFAKTCALDLACIKEIKPSDELAPDVQAFMSGKR